MVITESLLNLCCKACVSTNPKVSEATHNNICKMLHSVKEKDIPIESRDKFNLCKAMNRLSVSRVDRDIILDNIRSAGRFNQLNSIIDQLDKSEMDDDQCDKLNDWLIKKIQLKTIVDKLPNIEQFIEKFQSNSFDDSDGLIDEWGNMISSVNASFLNYKRQSTSTNIREIDLFSDPYDAIIKQIKDSYSGENSISTGFTQLDSYMNGGFEPKRLYIFGGASGDGKSVLLNNFLVNAVNSPKNTNFERKNIYIYFTLENLIDESVVRMYCCLNDLEVGDFMKHYDKHKVQIMTRTKAWQLDNNSVVVMAYMPPTMTSVSDLTSYVDLVKSRYDNVGNVKAVYVDYLDLLRSGQTFDMHRLELGQVTIDMKVAAVLTDVPLITVTQLNKGGYNDSEIPSLTNIGESMKKVEHSDFVGTIRALKDKESIEKEFQDNNISGNKINAIDYSIDSETPVKIAILKNRSGPKNKIVTLKARYNRFKLYDCGKSDTPTFDDAELEEQFQVVTHGSSEDDDLGI